MLQPEQLTPDVIFEILASATETGILTQADRYQLRAAILNEFSNEEEIRAVNRLLRAVLKGRIRIVLETSAVM